MRYVSQAGAHIYKNGKTCTAHEYETDDKTVNIARVVVTGRYPETGHAVNTEVSEVAYVESGSGLVSVNDVETPLQQGDVVSVLAGERVYWQGDFSLIIACAPAWHSDQYKHLQ